MGQSVARAGLAAEDFFVGDWLVQPSLGVVMRLSVANHLEPKTMEVLVCLARDPGQVISKDELLRSVWAETFVTEHVLTHAIWQLRHTFGDGLIQTIPRRGYRLTAAVRSAIEHVPTIAVLPLANLSGNPEQDYFADGMTEALISAVAQIAALRVISRTSVMQYKATTKAIPQIATDLKAERIVEGSVIRAGDRVRVSVQLINGRNDHHLWAKTYDRELRDVLELQDEVARAIAGEIQVTLTPQEQNRLVRPRPVHPEAHELYLRGRYCYFRTTEQGLRTSVDYMQQAIAVDPEYALAHAGLASSLTMLSSAAVMAMAPITALEDVRAAVRRALELDPNLPEAYDVLGWIRRVCEWDWTGAEEAYRRALALNPSYAGGYGWLGFLLLGLNRLDDAVWAWQQACKLDPLSLLFQCLCAYVTGIARGVGEAIEQLQKTIHLEPHYYYPRVLLAGAYSHLGRHDEAIAMAESAFQLCQEPNPRAYLAYVYARAGKTAEARQFLSQLQELEKTRYITPGTPAAVFVALGEFETALDYLEKAQEVREPEMTFIRISPIWKPLHGHPRFDELVRRMKFPA